MEFSEKIYFDGVDRACKMPLFSSHNVEYTRTDAFIEKVSEWLKDCATFTDMNGKKRIDKEMYKALVEDFRNYMEGGER